MFRSYCFNLVYNYLHFNLHVQLDLVFELISDHASFFRSLHRKFFSDVLRCRSFFLLLVLCGVILCDVSKKKLLSILGISHGGFGISLWCISIFYTFYAFVLSFQCHPVYAGKKIHVSEIFSFTLTIIGVVKHHKLTDVDFRCPNWSNEMLLHIIQAMCSLESSKLEPFGKTLSCPKECLIYCYKVTWRVNWRSKIPTNWR